MEGYKYLLDIAIILISTKFLSICSRHFKLPAVVGALIAGVILGPVCLNVITIENNTVIESLAEIGVIVLMFQAGLETDLKELKKSGMASFIIALCGVIVPLLLGTIVGIFFEKNILQDIFIGVILTATSVSITVETLQEMGKLKSRAGTAILGAAIIDDILGVILLSIITSIGASGKADIASILIILLKILVFFIVSIVLGILVYRFFKWSENRSAIHRRRIPVLAFSFCLLLSYASEFFGIADITGAYIAGVILCNLSENKYILSKVEVVSYMFISPIFFASIGLKTVISGMDFRIVIFTVVITIVAIISKVLGCGLASKALNYTKDESLQIGVGMISRGEVALIMANKGITIGLLTENFFAPIIIMVIATTLITPILLNYVFKERRKVNV